MGFILPQVLWLLLLLLPLALLWRWSAARARKRLETFAHRDTWGVLAANVATQRRAHKGVLLFAAVFFSILAAARPYWGVREREVRRSGLDIMIALDVSQSMLARDITPTRLESAKRSVRELLSLFPGQRVALLPFAGDAFVQCPLTGDYGIFLNVLRTAEPATIQTPGTDIARAIEVATEAFKRGGQGNGVLVLFTDGEDHSGRAKEMAAAARTAGITIYTVGIGTQTGAPIRLADGRFKEDRSGAKVTTRLDLDTLTEVARSTGGQAFAAAEARGLDLGPLVGNLEAMQKGELAAARRVVREERYQWPLALALVLLVMEMLIGERRNARRAATTPQEATA